MDLPTHSWFFPHLSITSVDGKQHLSEVVFSALVGFSLYTTCTHHRVKKSPKRQCASPFVSFHSDFFLAKNQTLRVIRFPTLQACLFFPRPKVRYFFKQWKSDEWTKHYLTQMLIAINWRYRQAGKKITHAYEGSRSLHASALYRNLPGFRKKKSLVLF